MRESEGGLSDLRLRVVIVQVDVPVQGLESILDGSISVLSTEVCSILGSLRFGCLI